LSSFSGYIGFTTGTNDAYSVVKQYVKRSPKAALKKYLGELKRLSQFSFGDPKRDDTSKLQGFAAAWKNAACNDPNFVQTQLDVGQAMYMKPALKYAASVNVKSNLGKALFYGNEKNKEKEKYVKKNPFYFIVFRYHCSTWLAGKQNNWCG
jgi:hypothetical protein